MYQHPNPRDPAMRPHTVASRKAFWLTCASQVSLLGLMAACGDPAEAPTGPSIEPNAVKSSTAVTGFFQLSTGLLHTCAVTSDSRAFCWGLNAAGGVGDGTQTQRLTPVEVVGGHLFRNVSTDGF